MVTCNFRISIIKDKEKWLLIFKNSVRREFLARGSSGKLFLTRGKEKVVGPPRSKCLKATTFRKSVVLPS
jgi:hypothetical protein